MTAPIHTLSPTKILPKDMLIALLIVFIWGINFWVMKIGLTDFSPMVLGVLRFVFVIFPFVFFIKKTNIRLSLLCAYGLFTCFGQFSFGFFALKAGLSTGLTALIIQSQAFFTVIIAMLVLKETIKINQIIAMLVAVLALVLVGVGQYQGSMPLMAVFLMLCGAFSWAIGNVIIKVIGLVNPLALVVWGNISSLLAFIASAVAMDGMMGIAEQLQHAHVSGWLSVLFLAFISTLIGYVGWGFLISKYSASRISPLALLVPVVALVFAWLFLHEPLNGWHWFGIGLMMMALLVHVFGDRLLTKVN